LLKREFAAPGDLTSPGPLEKPQIQVIAAAEARTRVEQTVPVAATSVVGNDPDVTLLTVPGRRESDAALLLHGPNGSTLVLNDGVGNVHLCR
jgi:hypothetical protein